MKYSEKQALYKAASYCSKAEKAIFDVRKKLVIWGLDSNEIENIIKYLINEKFIDEERFCRSFIKDKMNINKWGKVKIAFELKKKQIPLPIVNKCFEEIESNDFDTVLEDLLKNKAKKIVASSEYEKRIKLMRFGLGRGYSFEQINKILGQILKNKNNNDEYLESFF